MRFENVNESNTVEITPASRVYVIGGISKYGKETGWNIASFERVRERVAELTGADVTIPHDFIPETAPYEDQMRLSFDFLRSVDAVVRLADWAESSGASRESRLCAEIGMPLIEEADVFSVAS